jgi:hypothetical protein
MRYASFFASSLFALSLAACGNEIIHEDGSGGSTSSTGDTSAQGSTGSGGLCAPYADASSAASVTIRFKNDSGLPIYLPVSCSTLLYDLAPFGGDPGVNYTFDASCLQTCEDLETQPKYECGACAPTSYLLAPGATRDVVWNGTGLQSGVMMPSKCYADAQPSCSQIVAAPSDDYDVFATGFSSCGPNCTCDADGKCDGDAQGAMATANPAKMTFPGDSIVEVDFGVCAFPCPDGDG